MTGRTSPHVTRPLTGTERRALRRLIDAAARRRDGRRHSLVDRCLALEDDPLLALDLAVSAHERLRDLRAGA